MDQGSRGGEGACTHPHQPSRAGEGGSNPQPLPGPSQGQASTSFPIVSNCTQASPVSCPSSVPSSSPQPENSRSLWSPLRQRAAGTPPEESSVHGVGAEEGQWSRAHPRGKGGEYNLLQAFPAQQPARCGRKGASGWYEGLDGSRSGQPAHPSPKQGCSELHAGRGRGRVPATPQLPEDSPHLPLGSAPGRALSSDGAGEGPCPTCLAPPVQLQVPPAALDPEGRVPATGASSGPAPLAVPVRGGQALPVAPMATTRRRKASGSGSSACRTRWRCAGGNAPFPQSQAASEPGAGGSSHPSTPESGSGSGPS